MLDPQGADAASAPQSQKPMDYGQFVSKIGGGSIPPPRAHPAGLPRFSRLTTHAGSQV
jgi:hypothetical protein